MVRLKFEIPMEIEKGVRSQESEGVLRDKVMAIEFSSVNSTC
jgi:hypothetical protein